MTQAIYRLALNSNENSAQCLFYIFQNMYLLKGQKLIKTAPNYFEQVGHVVSFLTLSNEWDLGPRINQDSA